MGGRRRPTPVSECLELIVGKRSLAACDDLMHLGRIPALWQRSLTWPSRGLCV